MRSPWYLSCWWVEGLRAGRQWIKVFQCRAPNNRLSRYVTPLFSTGFTMPLYFGPSLNSSMVVVMKTILRRMNKLLEKRCLIWNRCGSSFADGQRLMVLLFDALFTCSPSDNSSDKEDFAAMWGLHESLVWTSGNSWLNHSSSCFWSWTLFLPVEVSTVKAIFFAFRYAYLELVPELIYAEWEATIFIFLAQFFEHISMYFCVLQIFRVRENQLLVIVHTTTYHIQIIDTSLFPYASPSLSPLSPWAAHFTLFTDSCIGFIWISLFVIIWRIVVEY